MSFEPTVYIVDDEPTVREELRALAEGSQLPVEVFASAEEFLGRLRGDEAGCVLVEPRLKGMSGLELLSQLKSRNPLLMTIMVSRQGDVPVAVESMKQGAMDFLEKPLDHGLLLTKVEEALTRSQAARLNRAQGILDQGRLTGLTAREREILRLLAAGRSSKQIAAEQGISLKTVSNHRANLLAKTGAGNTAELVRLAVVAGSSHIL